MAVNTYILAPHTVHNFGVFKQAIEGFPDLITNKQVGRATPKSAGDVVDLEGGLLVAENNAQYIYVKANTIELESSGLLDLVQDAQLFTIDTQPFESYWLNVNL